MCVEGARAVQEQAIRKIDSDQLRVLVVWLPNFPGDDRIKACASTKTVPDPRATHYWDATASVSKLYGNVLGLPPAKQFAWDTYMIFGPDAEWTDSPPTPNTWMHQMGEALGRDHPCWLDSDELRRAVDRLLLLP